MVSLTCLEILMKLLIRRDKFAESCSSISVCLLSNRTEIKAHINAGRDSNCTVVKAFHCTSNTICNGVFYSHKSDHLHILWRFSKIF